MDATFTGNQISERRKALGLTQKVLAEQLHVTDKAVSKWERGINFPDLGLMENLAAALDTTPAVLLGLENAGQDKIISSITKISNKQLEDAHRDIRQSGWISLGSAVILTIAYALFGNDVRRTQTAYQLLHGLIMLFAIGGIYNLFKYGEIRRWTTGDWLLAYCAAFPAVIVNGAYLFLDQGLHGAAEVALYMISVCALQWLFYRVIRPKVIKALPVILTAAFAIWHSLHGNLPIEFILPAVCCIPVWLLCRIRKVP